MKYLVGLGAVAVIVILFAYFWLFSDTAFETAQEEVDQTVSQLETESEAPAAEMNGFGTMNDLLARGSSLECQITTIDNSVTSEGTFFVADQKIRGDFLTDAPDLTGTAVSSMIIDADTMYVWTEIDGESYGMKARLQAIAESELQTQEPVNLDERVKYSCQRWERVDQSIFNPPSDVMFQDMSQRIQEGMEYGTVYEEGEMPY